LAPGANWELRATLRREIRAKRRSLTPAARKRLDGALARQLAHDPIFLRSRHVACYLANDGEVDLSPVVAQARARNKRCYLPVLSPTFHNRLWFAPFNKGGRLTPNVFGIPEPVQGWRAMRPAWSLDLILVPLVAFDRSGNRLGMGGGFYDRTLAYLGRRNSWRKPHLMGVAYGFQECEGLPVGSWDIPLEAVVTEGSVHRF
jgi:5-formyltetrahydrofolate cyclo-ligase